MAMSYPIRAICEVGANGVPCGGGAEEAPGCRGTVWLEQIDPDTCIIRWEIEGLTPGLHGFHVHEKADFSNGCMSAGPHYNPFGKEHGGPDDEERHVGDLGNVVAGEDGTGIYYREDHLITLYGIYSVL